MGLLVVRESSAGFVNPGTRRDLLAPTRRAEHLPGASPDDQPPIEKPGPEQLSTVPYRPHDSALLDRLYDRRSHCFTSRHASCRSRCVNQR